jgi:hypothetical protein
LVLGLEKEMSTKVSEKAFQAASRHFPRLMEAGLLEGILLGQIKLEHVVKACQDKWRVGETMLPDPLLKNGDEDWWMIEEASDLILILELGSSQAP